MKNKVCEDMMKLALAGASGRMGQAIQAEAAETDTKLAIVGREATSLPAADALIDFTRPERTLELAALAAKAGIPFVSGTTGLDDAQFAQLRSYSETIPVLWAANMSIGVNVLMKLVADAAQVLNHRYDVEIIEMHHRHKVDAPSGTALALGKAAAAGRGVDFESHATLSREGITEPRKLGTIGFATARGGGVIGDHTVIFAGDHERIELGHYAQDRRIFAQGALAAAQWVIGKKPGFYSIADVIGL